MEHKERCRVLGKGTLVASRAKAGGLWQVEPSQRRIARAGPVLGAVLVGYACARVCVHVCAHVCVWKGGDQGQGGHSSGEVSRARQ